MLLEVRHDLLFTSGFLGGVAEDLDAGVFLQEGGFELVFVGVGAGGVGNYEEFGAGVGAAEFLEFVLVVVSWGSAAQVGFVARESSFD